MTEDERELEASKSVIVYVTAVLMVVIVIGFVVLLALTGVLQ